MKVLVTCELVNITLAHKEAVVRCVETSKVKAKWIPKKDFDGLHESNSKLKS